MLTDESCFGAYSKLMSLVPDEGKVLADSAKSAFNTFYWNFDRFSKQLET